MTKTKKRFEIWTVVSIVLLLLFLGFLVYPMLGLLKQSVFNSDGQFTWANFERFFTTYSRFSALFYRVVKIRELANMLKTPIIFTIFIINIACTLFS